MVILSEAEEIYCDPTKLKKHELAPWCNDNPANVYSHI